MVRVLHLLRCTPEFQTQRAAGLLVQHCGQEFAITTRTIGRGGNYRNGLFAFLALRKKIASDFDVVHIWDPLDLAVVTAAGASNIIFSSPRFPSRDRLAGVRSLMRKPNAHLVCSSTREHAAYLDSILPPERCHLVNPGVDFSTIKPGRNSALRAALGFAEQDFVFIAPGESTRWAGHRDALWAVSILHVLNPNWKLLIWGRGREADSCARFGAKLFQPDVLTVAERKLGRRVEFEELLPAADAVINVPLGQTPTLPLAICMAAGLPIIATESPWTNELFKDGKSAATVSRRSPRVLAQRALEVLKDSELSSRIGSAARTAAIESFSLEEFLGGYRSLYRSLGAGCVDNAPQRLAAI